METNIIYNQDCLEGLTKVPSESIDIAITSPPYWGQRGDDGIGLEQDPRDYINNISEVLKEVMRTLKEDGILWLNIGDAYNTPINWRKKDYEYSTLGAEKNGLDPKNSAYTKNRGKRKAFIDKSEGWLQYGNLLALPWRIVIDLCDAGYYYRGEVIWSKRKAMPEGRCRRPHRKHEMIYIITKSDKHKFTVTPPVPSVWDLKADSIYQKKGSHTSTYPLSLPVKCIQSSGKDKGVVLDPFMGSGTTALAAIELDFDYIGFELSTRNYNTALHRIKHYEMEKSQMLFEP